MQDLTFISNFSFLSNDNILHLKFLSLHSIKNEIASTVEFLSTMGYTNPAEDVSKMSGATKQDTELYSTIFKQLAGGDGKTFFCSCLNYLPRDDKINHLVRE